MFSPEERRRAVELYFTTPMTTAQVVEHLGYPTRQCLERWLAKDPRYAGRMAKPIILLETRTKAIELVLGGLRPEAGRPTARRGRRSRPQLGQGVPGGRHGRAATSEQERQPVQQARAAAKPECWSRRRRRGGAAPQGRGAGIGERVDAGGGGGRRKRPRRRPSAPVEQGEDAAGRPSGAGVFARLDDMLARVSRRAATHCHHARLAIDKYAGLRTEVAEAFAASKGRYGYRRIKAMLRTGVSEKVIRRIMKEDDLVAHVPRRRRYSSYEGESTPAPGNLVNRDFTAERPNEKWLTDITRG